jgi:hypothetical protein
MDPHYALALNITTERTTYEFMSVIAIILFVNRVLRIFGLKRDEVTGEERKSHN